MAEARFVISGREYPVPEVDSFTMDEAMVLYQYSELTLDKVGELEGLHPGVVAALMHVGIQRGNPEMKAKEIKEVVKAANLFDILAAIEEATVEDDAADPPASPPPSEPTSSDETSESEEPSGETSASTGDSSPVTHLRPTGTQD